MNTTLKEPKTLKDLVCTAAPLADVLKDLLGKDRITLAPVMEVFANA